MGPRTCKECGTDVQARRLTCPSCRTRVGQTTPLRATAIVIIAIAIGLFLGSEIAPEASGPADGGDCDISGNFDLSLCD